MEFIKLYFKNSNLNQSKLKTSNNMLIIKNNSVSKILSNNYRLRIVEISAFYNLNVV